MLSTPLANIADLRERARRRLPRMVFEYLDGGAEDEVTLRANRAAFEAIRLRPRLLKDTAQRQQSVELLGETWRSPMAVAPVGLAGVFWPRADVLVAKAAAEAGVPYILSTASSATLEDVAREAGGNLWFQLYVISRALADGLVDRALAAGYRTLVLTIDVPVSGYRERDLRNGFSQPFRITPRTALDVARHPAWALQMLRHGAPQLANLASVDATDADSQAALLKRQMDASYDWTALARLRERWPHRLLVKGVLHPDDARDAFALGVDGVILSNHGGRQLDGAVSALDVLPEVVAVAQGRPVLIDGGVRRGVDIVKARALGADAVLVGRAVQYGVAAAGQAGAARALAMLREEVDRVMALSGLADIADVNSALIAP
ncbi:alpha-hydroxy-acid oxidizing protein [Achromobacter sp. GG226]|uniref:alpha-hydroxy-acid oxidizing protein n=1 Tax=Verticiella alkaliphila TaxID=2779529 RepID=UPI001C0C4AB7|nr:alpha-hydroxy-acid oxidizing protein [Verticiella sp. GG226]MBU4611170.1 alpha-hydroxy-acid oxidizing protein [Verticiella sp. GG226]